MEFKRAIFSTLALLLCPILGSAGETEKPRTSLQINSAELQGGVNEGGAVGGAAATVSIDPHRDGIEPTFLSVQVHGGPVSRLKAGLSVSAIRLLSTDSQGSGNATSVQVQLIPLNIDTDLTRDDQELKAGPQLRAELSTTIRQLQLQLGSFVGPAAGFKCSAGSGCIVVPLGTAIAGADLTARLGVSNANAIELSLSASQLVNLFSQNVSHTNYDADAHLYWVYKRGANEYYGGAKVASESFLVKRATDRQFAPDRAYSVAGVLGINFDVMAEAK